jgi:superfamily I DNA/RNA helicase
MAYAMIQELDAAGMAARETGDEYVAPDKVLRDGPAVEIRRSESEEASRQHALEWIRERLARGAAPEEILVLGLSRLEMLSLEIWLNDADIPVQLLVGRRAQPGAVRLSTIHSAKGLDSEHVLLLGAHQLERRRDEAEARRLLYSAMTRARTDLCISYQGSSALMAQLEELVPRAGQSSS